MSVPSTDPSPPLKLAPPMTTDAMTNNSYICAVVGCPTPPMYEHCINPATPQKNPASVYTINFTRPTRTPQSRAVSSFEPTA